MLRDVTEEDLPIFFEHQRTPEAHRMAAFPPREYDAFLAHWRTIIGNAAARNRTIVVDDCVAGTLGSWDDDGRRLVSYWIGQEYWGRGIATAALSEFLREEAIRPLFASRSIFFSSVERSFRGNHDRSRTDQGCRHRNHASLAQ